MGIRNTERAEYVFEINKQMVLVLIYSTNICRAFPTCQELFLAHGTLLPARNKIKTKVSDFGELTF